MAAEMIGLLTEELDTLGFGDETTRTRLTVALQEALSNALYHGNLEVSSDLRQVDERRFYDLAEVGRSMPSYGGRRIKVSTRVGWLPAGSWSRTKARVRHVPPGPPDRPGGPDEGSAAEVCLLIRAFMDEVSFNGTGNQITMVKR